MKQEHDVIIVGGGMVGLVLAVALARADFKLLVVEAKKPLLHWDMMTFDPRVSTIHQASYRILKNLNSWSALCPEFYTPLREMQVWDHLGGGAIHFNCAEVGVAELGFIVENREIVRALWQQLQQCEKIDFSIENTPIGIAKTTANISLTLSDQSIHSAKLIVGADGRQSWVREQMSAELIERSYQQHAIIAVVQMTESHRFTAYQNFLPNGPLALLPLHDPYKAVVVWSTKTQHAEELVQLTAEAFDLELTNALDHKLGEIKLVSERHKIPLMMHHTKNYVNERMALVGDAAHFIHPLAGQGANLGFMDAACLAQCVITAKHKNSDIGSLKTLRKYERWRKADNLTMSAVMRVFHEGFTHQANWLIHMRSMGLNFTNRYDFLKNIFMRYAMGEHADLPDLAKHLLS